MLTDGSDPTFHAWIGTLLDPHVDVRVDNGMHHVLRPDWRLDGLRLEGHVNWFIMSNGVTGQVAGRTVEVKAGGWLCLPPGTPLHFRPLKSGRILRLMRLRVHVCERGRQLSVPGGGLLHPQAWSLQAMASRLIAEQHQDGPLVQLRRRSHIAQWFLSAADHLNKTGPGASGQLSHGDALRLEAHVTADPAKSFTPECLARLLRMRPDTFSRAFARRYGQSPRSWLADRRIHHAAELLLTTGGTAAEVAAVCGFADPFHFNRRFHAVLGCGTRAWRQRHAGTGSLG